MSASAEWHLLGEISPAELHAARDVAHWGVQIVAAAGASLCEEKPDASHTSIAWSAEARAFVGVDLGNCRAALCLYDLRLIVLDARGNAADECPLEGHTLDQAIAWLAGALARVRGAPIVPLSRPKHELPQHALEHGAVFATSAVTPALGELARWYADADLLLGEIARATPRASAVRVWPHHFDIATLIALDPRETDPEKARTIGVGLSPGDGGYAEPYWYVTPWPYPSDPKDLTSLPLEGGGIWHERGWFGAVLRGSALSGLRPAAEQRRCAGAFVRSAMAACERLHASGPAPNR
jgi:hypothetical protein